MSTPIITRAKHFIKLALRSLALVAPVVAVMAAHAEWKVDFSRRQELTRRLDLRAPASSSEMPQVVDRPGGGQMISVDPPKYEQPTVLETLFESKDIAQEIVVLHTEKGFIPSNVQVKKGLTYKIDVVNVNEKEKNVSFVLEAFSEHHATYYGQIKSFLIRPQKEGVYRFVSPETAAQGKLVVYPGGLENRVPASN